MTKFLVLFAVCLAVFPAGAKLTESDEMIQEFYRNKDDIEKVNKECANYMKYAKGVFNISEWQTLHRSVLCYTWEVNKDLTEEQRNLLAKIKSGIAGINSNLYEVEKIPAPVALESYYNFTLQFLAKIYNLVKKEKLPECSYEVSPQEEHYFYPYTQPCNTAGKLLKQCQNTESGTECMLKKLTSEYSQIMKEAPREEYRTSANKKRHEAQLPEISLKTRYQKGMNNFEQTLNDTENFLKSIITNEQQRQKEILRLLNFYDLTITRNNERIAYYLEHD